MQQGFQYNFNKEGMNNMINIHEHLETLIKKTQKIEYEK